MNRLKIPIIAILFFLLSFLLSNDVSAACSGAFECGNWYATGGCSLPSGASCTCNIGIPGCTQNRNCVNDGNPGTGVQLCLENRNSCGQYCGVCVVNNWCDSSPPSPPPGPTATPPPPPPAGCNFGSCGVGCGSSTQRFVSGSCNPPYSWFSGDGCYTDGSCGGGGPTPPPPPATGTLLGRVFYDYNGDGIPNDGSYYGGIQNSLNSCGSYMTQDGFSVNWSGGPTTAGSNRVNELNNAASGCSPPYYARNGLLPGNYSVSLTRPSGWVITSIFTPSTGGVQRCSDNGDGTANCTITSSQDSHAWFGVQQTMCSFDLTDVTVDVGKVNSGLLTNIVEQGANLLIVDFASTDTGIASVTSPDISSVGGWRTNVTGNAVGTTTYTATATMNDALPSTQCIQNAPGTITVNNTSPWWQVMEGSIVSATGDISSQLPDCSGDPTGLCQEYLIATDPVDSDNEPGVAIGDGTISATRVSHEDWAVEGSQYSGPLYTYDFFYNKVSGAIKSGWQEANLNSALTSLGTVGPNGYRWIYVPNDVVLDLGGVGTDTQDIGSAKIILFVDGNLTINDKIKLDDGTGFFMTVVSGRISINGVGGDFEAPTPEPDLEGIFYSDGVFNTKGVVLPGFSDNQLHIRGSVAAQQINLQRSLAANTFAPAEYFEYAPDLILNFPPNLLVQRIKWREVAP